MGHELVSRNTACSATKHHIPKHQFLNVVLASTTNSAMVPIFAVLPTTVFPKFPVALFLMLASTAK